MKNYKKVLALVLSLLMVVAAVPLSSLAEAGLERTVRAEKLTMEDFANLEKLLNN